MLNTVPYLVALLCVVGTALYTIRAADRWKETGWWDRALAAAGVALWVAMIAAWWDVGVKQDGSMLWRQWTVATPLSLLVLIPTLKSATTHLRRTPHADQSP